jgi:hypothetical protein
MTEIQMFKTARFFVEYDFLCFGHLSFRDSVIVSYFDIRISYFPARPPSATPQANAGRAYPG